jgi:hypothetical protein
MTRPDDPPHDDLIAHDHEASAQDTRQPAVADPDVGPAPANQSRWKLALLTSVVLAALGGLLVLQFDRDTPEKQDAVYGERSPSGESAPPLPAAAPRANDAASLHSAAPAQAREEPKEQAPRTRLVPGSPAAAMAIALHEAARTGRITQLDSLLRQGALINEPDAAGRTPLTPAVIHGQTAAVQRLLAAGANTTRVDLEGLTALQHARRLGLSQIAAAS